MNEELAIRVAVLEGRLAAAVIDRKQVLAGHNAAKLLDKLRTAGRMQELAPAADALASVGTAITGLRSKLIDAGQALFALSINDAQRVKLAAALTQLEEVDTGLGELAATIAFADNAWRGIPEPDRLALAAMEP